MAQGGLGIKPIAEFLMLSTGYECFRKSLIDALVHEKASEGDTPLAAELGTCFETGALSAIAGGSASARTIPGSFPPSSTVRCFRVGAADAKTLRPVSEDPV
jgi:hypothetical protein